MKYIFTLISLLFTSVSQGQINIINQSLTDSSLNIFYIGIDNRIKLKVDKNIGNYHIAIKGAGGLLSEISLDEYLVRVNKIDTCQVIVYNRKGKEVLVRKYKTDVIPTTFATLNRIKDTTISKNRILLNPFLILIMPGCYYKLNVRILSFQATFIKNYDSTFTYSESYRLTEDQLKLIKELSHGDEILFSRILVSCPSARSSFVPAFWIKIE